MEIFAFSQLHFSRCFLFFFFFIPFIFFSLRNIIEITPSTVIEALETFKACFLFHAVYRLCRINNRSRTKHVFRSTSYTVTHSLIRGRNGRSRSIIRGSRATTLRLPLVSIISFFIFISSHQQDVARVSN